MAAERLGPVFDRQPLHWLALAALLVATIGLHGRLPEGAGAWLGLPAEAWFVAAVAAPILHQHWVWLGWRLELHHGWLSRRFGERAFAVFSAVFEVLILSRVVTVLGLAVATRGTLGAPPAVRWTLVVVLLAAFGWLMYSVVRHFGLDRSRGADHFVPAVRARPLCREGIFRYVPHAMYTIGPAVLWAVALAFDAAAALLVAGFSNAYIWVHYACTEAPDMRFIYGSPEERT